MLGNPGRQGDVVRPLLLLKDAEVIGVQLVHYGSGFSAGRSAVRMARP